MPSSVSSSKGSIRILLLEGVNDSAVELFVSSNFSNIERLPTALDADGLLQVIKGVDLLGIRSRTQLTREALAGADRLVAVGCFSVGTNQVDLDAARQRGIPVFNAPFSNTRSVAELVIGEIVMLLRRIFPRSSAAHKGGWDKSATDSHEVRGRTLGIVGYGNIGSQLSTLAEGMGMKVIYYDHTDRLRHGNTEPVESLQNLLAQSDIVSPHVPETPTTHGMIGEAELRLMKRGAYLINNSRGTVVDLDALSRAVREGRLAGAALDVFPVEPSSNSERFQSPCRAWKT
jgi:D-3-phosphoglycerate dehydrogenase / 2-oxoglutarate reductase